MIFFTSRGGRSNEGTVQIDGMNVGSAFNGGGVAGYGYDTVRRRRKCRSRWPAASARPTAAARAFNLVPKTGGNTFSGTYFGNIAGEWSQGDNVDDELRSFGIPNAGRDHPELGYQLRAGRPDQAGQRVVLRHGADVRQPTPTSPAASPTPTPATRPGGTTWPIRASRSASATSRKIGGVPRDGAAHAAEQGQRLLRLPEGVRGQLVRQGRRAVPRPRRRLDRGGRLRHLVAGIDALARQLRDASCSSRTRRR